MCILLWLLLLWSEVHDLRIVKRRWLGTILDEIRIMMSRLFKLIETIPLLIRSMHSNHGVMGLQVWRMLFIEGWCSRVLFLGVHHWSFLSGTLHIHIDVVIMLLVELVDLKHGRRHLHEVLESIHWQHKVTLVLLRHQESTVLMV